MDTQQVGYVELASFPDYTGAQELVDRLSDKGFEGKRLRIVGNGLHSVEQVTGRLTVGRAAAIGAGSGAWLGLFLGLLFGLFTPGIVWVTVILVAVLIGAFWGAVFGAVAQWTTRGRRDFASVRSVEATTYAVMVESTALSEAARLSAA